MTKVGEHTRRSLDYIQLWRRNLVKKKNQKNWIGKQHLSIAKQGKNSQSRYFTIFNYQLG
jgi:hypothetical protein